MSKQMNEKMAILKKVFFVLLVLDVIELILMVINLIPTFKQMAGYGQIMMVVTGVLTAVMVAILLFEILAKVFLIRNTSNKRYVSVARLLLLFNLGAVVFGLLSAGGEGANLVNQIRTYLGVLFSVAEVIAAYLYLRMNKKMQQDN